MKHDTAETAAREDDGHADLDETIADRVFRAIGDAIITGRIASGSKLSEPELARRFGISRGPLREAIRRLEERRLVTRSPRLGARVVTITREMMSETFAVREVLEGLAAREAARNVTDEEIAELRRLLDLHREQIEGGSGAYAQSGADEDFHFAIVKYSRNTNLFHLLCDEYYQLIRLYRFQHAIVRGRAQRAFVEHTRIADAIADRDADLAEMLMRRHIRASHDNMIKALGVQQSGEEPAGRKRQRRASVRPA